MEGEKPVCRHFKGGFSPELMEGEILIKAELCRPQEISEKQLTSYLDEIKRCSSRDRVKKIRETVPWEYLTREQEEKLKDAIERRLKEIEGKVPPHVRDKYHSMKLKLNIPTGKLADIVRIVTYIKSKFDQVNVKVEISTKEGEITISDYEDKVKEAVKQANIIVEEEELKSKKGSIRVRSTL